MSQIKQIQFTIPEPCSVPWNMMSAVERDQRHCLSCEKVVTDFSKMSDDELMLYFRHGDGKTCGRFLKTQLNRPMTLLPEQTVSAKWWRTLILIPLTLFGKQTKAQFVEVVNQMRSPDTVAIVRQNDSLRNDSIAKEKIALNDTVKQPNVDLKKLISTKIDSPYVYVWKFDDGINYDSLHPYIITDILVSGGCIAIQPVIVIPKFYTFPWVLEPYRSPYWPDVSSETVVVNVIEPPKSILTIFLDTIVPFRKKKRMISSVATNSEKVGMKDPMKEITDQPKEKPKEAAPAIPASNEITGILPDERKKLGRS